MEIADVQPQIEAAANKLAIVAPSLGTNKGKAYEAWILFEIAVRLLERGYEVRPVGPSGADVSAFRLRGSPSGMPTEAATNDPPSHFFLAGSKAELEMHVGVQVQGVSGTPHEVDISVLPLSLGVLCRQSGGGYYNGPLHHGLELKAYDTKHKLNQGMPRALLGVALDLDPTWATDHWICLTFARSPRLLSKASRARYALLTSTRLYDNSRLLLGEHGVLSGEHLLPAGDEAAISILVEEIAAILGDPRPPRSRSRPLPRSTIRAFRSRRGALRLDAP